MQPTMPPPLPTDIRFATEYEKYVVYNFHRPAFIDQAKALLGTKNEAQPRILILSGERDIGRKYFLDAVEYGLAAYSAPRAGNAPHESNALIISWLSFTRTSSCSAAGSDNNGRFGSCTAW